MEQTGNFYLYVYPILSSIFAGVIFWLIFSYAPERKRRTSFGVGVFNDLLALNGHIFSYFDLLLRFQKHSPSNFQEKIHACSLSVEDINLGLQNKIISQAYINQAHFPQSFLAIGDEMLAAAAKMDVVIERLYSFNYFLSSQEVQLIRDMHEKIHRYVPYIESNMERSELLPVNPTLAFMGSMVFSLQSDYIQFRKLIYQKNLNDRSYVLSKIQRLFYSSEYKKCIAECRRWISKDEFNAEELAVDARKLVSKLLPRFKHNGFRDEREFRFVVHGPEKDNIKFRQKGSVIVPYVELSLGAASLPINFITVGPGNDAQLTQKSVDLYLRARGYGKIEVRISDVPFRP